MSKGSRTKLFTIGIVFLFLVALITGFFVVPPVKATAFYFQDGFESGNTNAWNSVTGTVNVNTAHPFTGTYSANITSAGTYPNYVHYVQENEAYAYLSFCARYYISTLSLEDPQSVKIMEITSNGPKGVQLWIERNGASYYWRVKYIDALDSGEISTKAPAQSTWYGLELSWNHTGGSTYVQFYVNASSSTDIAFSGNYPDGYSSLTSACKLGSVDYSGSGSMSFKSWFDDASIGDSYLGCPPVSAPGSDTTPPAFLDGNPYLETNTLDWNTSITGELCTVSVNSTDNVGLSGYILSYTTDLNGTAWHNNTWLSTSGTNTKISGNFTIPVPTIDNWFIYANFYANDTSNNWGKSLGLWPATTLTIGAVFNATKVSDSTFPTSVAAGNKAGSRRIFHSTYYWIAFWEDESQRINDAISSDGYTWTSKGTINNDPANDLVTDSEGGGNWAPYVVGSNLYLVYANGTYNAGANQTSAFFRTGTISSTGTITWSARGDLVYYFRTLISSQWSNPSGTNFIYGFWSFSWSLSLDGSRVWLAFRLLGTNFVTQYARIFIGYIVYSSGNLYPSTVTSCWAGSTISTDQLSVQTDPSYNTGFLLLYHSASNGYVYYQRWDGTQWMNVAGGVTTYAVITATVCSDWSTVYVSWLGKTFFVGQNIGLYCFPNDATTSGGFSVDAGDSAPTPTYSQLVLAHSDNELHIICTDGNLMYAYTKIGSGVFSAATVRAKSIKGFTSLSATENAGMFGKNGLLWGNLTGATYDVLFGEWGSSRFSVSLTLDMEGCGNWVFVNERFYNFNLTISHIENVSEINNVELMFSLLTKQGAVQCTFLYVSGNFSISYLPSNVTVAPVRVEQNNVSIVTGWLTEIVDFQIYFTSDALDVWQNDSAIDVSAFVSDTSGASTGWQIIASKLFRIYNQGGYVLDRTTTGVAGVIDTGTPFSFYAQNNSYVYRDLIYRDLAHIKMLPEISAIIGHQTFFLSYGIDYCLKGYDWVEGWKVVLMADSVTTNSALYFNWSVAWYNRGVFLKQEYVLSFLHTNLKRIDLFDPNSWFDPNANYGASTSVWIDLWFDRQNASSVGGGRVNAFEYPMQDNVAPWLALFGSNWGPVENATKESMNLVPLLDGDNATVIPASQIKMVKVWSSLSVVPYATDQMAVVSDMPVFDLTFSPAGKPLTGIQTPVFDQTQHPDMPNGGLMGALFSSMSGWFKWLGDNILYGGLDLWPTFVGFLDTVAAMLGFPGFFTWLFARIGDGFGWMVTSFGYIGQMFTQFFIILGSFMGYLVTVLSMAATTIVNMIGIVTGLFTGAFGTGINIWNSLGGTTWLMLVIILYPFYLFVLWDEEGIDAVMSQLTFIFNVLHLLAGFFISVVQLVISAIHSLIEAIPVVE